MISDEMIAKIAEKKLIRDTKILIIVVLFIFFVIPLFIFFEIPKIKHSYFGMFVYVNLNYHKILESDECRNTDWCYKEIDSYGFVSEGNWVGFFYSSDNKPNYVDWEGYKGNYKDLTKINKNTWKLNQGGDNYIYVKRIRKNFFYYKIHC